MSMIAAIVGALILGAVSTFGDFIWAALHLQHRTEYGLIHGAVICLFIGGVVGARAGRLLSGAAVGPLIGLLAAAGFYALAPWLGYSAMFPMWMLFWFCFALLKGWLRGGERFSTSALRGLTAALLSGLVFYAISGIWTRPSPGGPDYLRHFVSWTLAFWPGFVALFWRERTLSG